MSDHEPPSDASHALAAAISQQEKARLAIALSAGDETIGGDSAVHLGKQLQARLKEIKTKESNQSDLPPGILTYQTLNGATFTQRPTVGKLLYGDHDLDDEEGEGGMGAQGEDVEQEFVDHTAKSASKRKYGIWDGVFARCLLNIFGVIMFLRTGLVMGSAGLVYGVIVILVSALITTLTTLSLSAITTNGEVMGGGAYLMISRALGPSFGGAIGLLFTTANAVSVSLYIIGFCEAVRDQTSDAGFDMTPGGSWDIRIFSLILLLIVFAICMGGIGWVIKIQLGLLVMLVLCILSVIVGMCIVKPNEALGITGLSLDTLRDNWGPDPSFEPQSQGVFFAFSIFFPAVTGIMAGANISGEIKDAHSAIPKGTLLAILVSTLVYVVIAIMLCACVTRATLKTNFLIMADLAVWAGAIFIGVYAATLSSAIASFVGAPRILQAVADDGLFPFLRVFAKEWRGEPVNGYLLTCVVGAVCILVGDLNAVAPLISGFFLVSYMLVNLACFAASYVNTPGWRPTFRFYNKWVALVSALLCLAVLFLLGPLMAAITLVIGAALYKYVDFKDPDVSWGSAMEAGKYKRTLKSLAKLETVREHVKNYRPQLLVLSGSVSKRLSLVVFAQQFRKSKGVILYGEVLLAPSLDDLRNKQTRVCRKEAVKRKQHTDADPLRQLKMPFKNAFTETIVAVNLREGARSMLQLSGLSKVRPNTLLLGWQNWQKKTEEQVRAYVDIVRDGFFFNYGVMIMRGADKVVKQITQENPKHEGTLDVWWLFDDGGLTILMPYLLQLHRAWQHTHMRIFVVNVNSQTKDFPQMSRMISKFRIPAEIIVIPLKVEEGGLVEDINPALENLYWSMFPEEVTDGPQEEDTIREGEPSPTHAASVDATAEPGEPAAKQGDEATAETPVTPATGLMSMFDAPASPPPPPPPPPPAGRDVVVHVDAASSGSLLNMFAPPPADTAGSDDDTDGERLGEEEREEGASMLRFEAASFAKSRHVMSSRARRHLKVAELIREHSRDAALIMITMPVPEVNLDPFEYMRWLDCLSHPGENDEFPPVCLLRGNQETVITFEL